MKNKIFSLSTELPVIYKISEIYDECNEMKTFFFDHSIDFRPGQFVMLWIPAFDEKPFTISYHFNTRFGITVQLKGKFTRRLFDMKRGDKLGMRGPYGNGFLIKKDKNACVIGGGCGIATMASIIEKLDNPLIILGARTKENMPFKDFFKNAVITTDDGSMGEKAFPTDVFQQVFKKNKIEIVYSCGPELMLKKLSDICIENQIECQVSLERYMKCGFGVCGQCVCGTKRVCADGPVFDLTDLDKLSDFGSWARNKAGKKISITEY